MNHSFALLFCASSLPSNQNSVSHTSQPKLFICPINQKGKEKQHKPSLSLPPIDPRRPLFFSRCRKPQNQKNEMKRQQYYPLGNNEAKPIYILTNLNVRNSSETPKCSRGGHGAFIDFLRGRSEGPKGLSFVYGGTFP